VEIDIGGTVMDDNFVYSVEYGLVVVLYIPAGPDICGNMTLGTP
jgi:hypothetical protein